MPVFDIFHYLFLGFLILHVIYRSIHDNKQQKRIEELINKNDRLAIENDNIKHTNQQQADIIAKRPKAQELKEFLRDMDIKGYSLLRIDPDDVFYRGRN